MTGPGYGFGGGAMQPAQPRPEAAEEPEISGATCLWSQRQIPHAVHAWKWGPVLRWCTGVDEDAAPRPSAAPQSPQSAGVAAGDGTDGPEPSQGTTAPGSVPEELIQPLARMLDEAHLDGCDENCTVQKGDFENAARAYLARALPAHEAMVRQRVAEELRTDAASHRRLAARRSGDMRGGLESRADTLERAAERITRGGQA